MNRVVVSQCCSEFGTIISQLNDLCHFSFIQVQSADIGDNVDGSTFFSGGRLTMSGTGIIPINGNADSLHYTYISLDGYVDARIFVKSFTGTTKNQMVGLMIRETLEPDSQHWSTMLKGDGGLVFISRKSGNNGYYDETPFAITETGVWLRITGGSSTSVHTYYSEAANPMDDDWLYSGESNTEGVAGFHLGIAVAADTNDILIATDFSVNGVEISGTTTTSQCNSTSYNVCTEFVREFDYLYSGRDQDTFPLGNPMRKSENKPIYPLSGMEALEHVVFPTAYEFTSSIQGIHYLESGEYNYTNLYDFPGQVTPSRGSWTPHQDDHWLRCSHYSNGKCRHATNKIPNIVSNDESHPFRCCSSTANVSPWHLASASGCDSSSKCNPMPPAWCPHSLHMNSDDLDEEDRCLHGTFHEAVEYCTRHGGRLCTSEELANNCAAYSGCDSRTQLVWAAYSFEYSAETECRSSQNNYELSRRATKTCDDSISLLVGSTTSVGMVARYAAIVNAASTVGNATDRLPGKCCMDDSLNSEHFGFNVSFGALCICMCTFITYICLSLMSLV